MTRARRRPRALAIAALMLGTVLGPTLIPPPEAVAGSPCRVTQSGSASGVYSDLQAALDAAASGDTLTLRGICTGSFTVLTDLTLVGKGRATLDGAGLGSVLFIAADVTLTDLTIRGGVSSSHGGGIYNTDTLTLSDVTVIGNVAAGNGGGIFNSGTLTMSGSLVADNVAGDLDVAAGYLAFGGGLLNGGDMTITDSVIRGNAAGGGGGIANFGTLNIDGTTIGARNSRNVSVLSGGGIANLNGVLTFLNRTTTIDFNTAHVVPGWNVGAGGGIYNNGAGTSSVSCGSPSLVAYGSHNEPDDSFDGILGSNTVCPPLVT